MSTKALLKAVSEAIRAQRWDEAIQQAQSLLANDFNNYQAHIFLAYSLDKTNRLEDAEKVYEAATKLRPAEAQAWQGLVKVYEKQDTEKLPQLQRAVLNLAQAFRDQNEIHKCQDIVDKFVDYVRIKGDRLQYVDALEVYLPESPIYSALEGRVPHPAKTYETIAQIVETEEKKRINTLIGERRTRIGAKVTDVTIEVKREVLGASKLSYVYRQLINWTNDDEQRRKYEEKLLQHCHDRLLAFPTGKEKAKELKIVQKLAEDMVIIKHPFKLAWDISLDWKDHREIRDYDFGVLREYCTLFPDSDLHKVLVGFLTSAISPFPQLQDESAAPMMDGEAADDSDDDSDGGAPTSVIPLTEEDRLLSMADGVSTANSLFAYRLMGEYYQRAEEEHESNVELMRKAFDQLKSESLKTGLSFLNTEDAFSLFLGTALVFYQSPRNHKEAKSLFDKVLGHDSTSTPALIGVGLILEEEEEFDEAIAFFDRAIMRDPTNLRVKSEAAWVKALRGDYATGRVELEACVSLLKGKDQVSKDLLGQTLHRLGTCLWNLDTSRAARKSRTGAYAYFVDALKSNLNYAPAYTSLGVYYADYAKDKKRARRCFQKAVELSSSEVEAAERLARLFADEGDWDRVELVAQRVVDSGKVRPPPGSKRSGISWPFSALGVAELNKQDYTKAIISFQSALRIAPNDYFCWVGLGESYHNSGRYISATKAILNAQKLESFVDADIIGDTWFTKFMLANVKRELAEYDHAIALYQEVAESHPDEEGVAIALMQTMVESALHSIDKGHFGKAVELARGTISFSTGTLDSLRGTFNFWKSVADSCSVFSIIQGKITDLPTDLIRNIFTKEPNPAYDIMKDIDGVTAGVIYASGIFPEDEKMGVDLTRCLHAAILAHKMGIHVSSHDVYAQAVAYYNLGWAEYRAHQCLPLSVKHKPSRYLRAAARCFKRAIELEASNSEFWNALGVVTSEMNPLISQHAFVRSVHLNERNAQAWTNLGALALLQNDFQIANESFTRAQSTDPDYAHAWLGQGFVALLYGDVKEARGLFTHAMDIAESSSVISREQYSVSVFDHVLTAPSNLPITSILQPIFALAQLRGLKPQELAYGHLGTLFKERIQDKVRSVEILESICDTLEVDYESTESPLSLKRFALAKVDLARAHLAAGQYEKAIECGEMALQLSSNESESELSPEERNKARLSAHLTLGLAQYYNEDVPEALTYFETALDESNNNPDAVCVLAQVLWAAGTEDSRQKARDALFGVIEEQPDHVQSVLLLGIIALMDKDEESIEAVVAELHSLRVNERTAAVGQSHIGEVLQSIAVLSEGSKAEDVVTQAQTDIMLYPHLPHGWSNLAQASEGKEAQVAADMALTVALKAMPPRGDLGAEDLAAAYGGTSRAADAQLAIFAAPWVKDGWVALSDAVKGA